MKILFLLAVVIAVFVHLSCGSNSAVSSGQDSALAGDSVLQDTAVPDSSTEQPETADAAGVDVAGSEGEQPDKQSLDVDLNPEDNDTVQPDDLSPDSALPDMGQADETATPDAALNDADPLPCAETQCTIGGSCFDNGAIDPANRCQVCDTGKTKTAWTLQAAGVVCRSAGGACDIEEQCDGTHKECPADMVAADTVVCRAVNGTCDLEERCDGTTKSCPDDLFKANTVACRATGGVCDMADNCPGFSPECVDLKAPDTKICRVKNGDCDAAEQCDGKVNTCPADAAASNTTVCRPAAGDCDKEELCNGTVKTCPADTFKPVATVCRAKNGDCDVEDTCTGTSAVCADVVAAKTVECRAANGGCDKAETCTGTAKECPADLFQPQNTLCTDDGNRCNGTERCDGKGACGHVAPVVCDVGDFCLEKTGACYKKQQLVLIPPGKFWMGAPEGERGRQFNETLHYVWLTQGFAMHRHEVTQAEFTGVMGYNPSYFRACGNDCPVEQINWYETLAYANELSKLEGLPECFTCTGTLPNVVCALKPAYTKPQDCDGYRLPTESEWEYAVRAGTTTAFYNGDVLQSSTYELDNNLNEIGWYGGNSGASHSTYDCGNWYFGSEHCGSHPVEQKLPNGYGLFDMSGNVAEWVWDADHNYPAGTPTAPLIDPTGSGNENFHIRRGGFWLDGTGGCRSAYRANIETDHRNAAHGFRLVRKEYCTSGATRIVADACGTWGNGDQPQTCIEGRWQNAGSCIELNECSPDATRTLTDICGFNGNGEQLQKCVGGEWENEGHCTDPDSCENGTRRIVVCGSNNLGDQKQQCVNGTWINDGDCNMFPYIIEGLAWSKPQGGMTWGVGYSHCQSIGGRMPTISEVRTLIQNCPMTVTGGSCNITDSCASGATSCNATCDGCGDGTGWHYSKFGDTVNLWSASYNQNTDDYRWYVYFSHGGINWDETNHKYTVRCVKD